MPIARVSGQTPQANGANTVQTIAITLPQNVVAGNFIGCIGGSQNSNAHIYSDNLANSFANDVSRDRAVDANHCSIGTAKNISTGGAATITLSQDGTPANARMGIAGMEWSGFSGGAALDKTFSNDSAGTPGTSIDTGATAATTANDELLLAGVKDSNNGVPYTWGSSFSLIAETGSAAGRTSSGDRIVTATGTYNGTATASNSIAWAAVIATYKAAAGGAALTHDFSRFPIEKLRTPSESFL
jgi:hypothetical protein